MRMVRQSWDFFFCTPVSLAPRGRLFFWSYVYYLSKFYEFLDTILLLFKAKPASFLHVFHHALVVVMAWLWVDQQQTLQWVGLLSNTFVHVIMYWYYYETTVGNNPWWKKYITSMQIVQFSIRYDSGTGWSIDCESPLSWQPCSIGRTAFV
jgi:fatty acid elongase 3